MLTDIPEIPVQPEIPPLIPAQPEIPEIIPTDNIDADDTEANRLTEEVDGLWSAHNNANLTRKHSTAELRRIKLQLGERLHQVKVLLAGRGRGGLWLPYLRERKIPRSSADRLVERYLETVGENVNAPSEALTVDEAIERLLKSVVPRANQLLPDDEAKYKFILRLASRLGFDIEESADCFMVSLVEPGSADGDLGLEEQAELMQDDENGVRPHPDPYGDPDGEHDEIACNTTEWPDEPEAKEFVNVWPRATTEENSEPKEIMNV